MVLPSMNVPSAKTTWQGGRKSGVKVGRGEGVGSIHSLHLIPVAPCHLSIRPNMTAALHCLAEGQHDLPALSTTATLSPEP